MNDMMLAIASAEDQPAVTFKALERLVDKTIGIKLFTLMEIDPQRGVAWRNYSNQPDAYPIAGEKPLQQNRWSEIVEQRQQIFIANTIDEIAEVFGDFELIRSLGCESCVNIPIVIAGRLRGTLNCLHQAHHYTADRVAAAHTLKPAGALAFLMASAASRITRTTSGESHG